MKVGDIHYRSIWFENDQVRIIDQRWLPHDFRIATLETLDDFATAIRDMWVRGAPLIGVPSGKQFGLLQVRPSSSEVCMTTSRGTVRPWPSASG